MSQRLSKIWTFALAMNHLTMRLKEYTDETIGPQGWAEILNLKIMQSQEILNLKNSQEYKEGITIVPVNYSLGGQWNWATGDALNRTTKVLHLVNGSFANFSTDCV